MRVTPSQAHALTVLNSEWQTAAQMRVLSGTLEALVCKGFAEVQGMQTGTLPRIEAHYRRKL